MKNKNEKQKQIETICEALRGVTNPIISRELKVLLLQQGGYVRHESFKFLANKLKEN